MDRVSRTGKDVKDNYHLSLIEGSVSLKRKQVGSQQIMPKVNQISKKLSSSSISKLLQYILAVNTKRINSKSWNGEFKWGRNEGFMLFIASTVELFGPLNFVHV